MTEDARLTDFVGSDDAADERDGSDGSAVSRDGPDAAADANEDASPERQADVTDASDANPASHDGSTAIATYAWGEYTCERCGESTERAWRDDGAYVCPACKRW